MLNWASGLAGIERREITDCLAWDKTKRDFYGSEERPPVESG